MKKLVVLLVIVFLLTGSAWGKEKLLYSQRRLGNELRYSTSRGDSVITDSPLFTGGTRLDARYVEEDIEENAETLPTGRSTAIYLFRYVPRGVLSFSLDIKYKVVQSDPDIITPLMVGILRPHEKRNGNPVYTNLELDTSKNRWAFEDLDGHAHLKNGTMEVHISAMNATADIDFIDLLCFGHKPRIERIQHYSRPPSVRRWTVRNVSYYHDYPGPVYVPSYGIYPRYDIYLDWWGGIQFVSCIGTVRRVYRSHCPVRIYRCDYWLPSGRIVYYEPPCFARYRRVHKTEVIVLRDRLPSWREVRTSAFLAQRDGSPRTVTVSTKTRKDRFYAYSGDNSESSVRPGIVRENREGRGGRNSSSDSGPPDRRSSDVRVRRMKTREENRDDDGPGTWTITTKPETTDSSSEGRSRSLLAEMQNPDAQISSSSTKQRTETSRIRRTLNSMGQRVNREVREFAAEINHSFRGENPSANPSIQPGDSFRSETKTRTFTRRPSTVRSPGGGGGFRPGSGRSSSTVRSPGGNNSSVQTRISSIKNWVTRSSSVVKSEPTRSSSSVRTPVRQPETRVQKPSDKDKETRTVRSKVRHQ